MVNCVVVRVVRVSNIKLFSVGPVQKISAHRLRHKDFMPTSRGLIITHKFDACRPREGRDVDGWIVPQPDTQEKIVLHAG